MPLLHKSKLRLVDLLESPQYYRGEVIYQKDNKFIPVPSRSFREAFELLTNDGEFSYFLHPVGSFGFVIDNDDLAANTQAIIPVMKLKLTPVIIGSESFMQVSQLRIRESYGQSGIARNWYEHYVRSHHGIVSDCEHLAGGKLLWQSLIKSADGPEFSVTLNSFTTGEKLMDVTSSTPESEIWSDDSSNKDKVLLFHIA